MEAKVGPTWDPPLLLHLRAGKRKFPSLRQDVLVWAPCSQFCHNMSMELCFHINAPSGVQKWAVLLICSAYRIVICKYLFLSLRPSRDLIPQVKINWSFLWLYILRSICANQLGLCWLIEYQLKFSLCHVDWCATMIESHAHFILILIQFVLNQSSIVQLRLTSSSGVIQANYCCFSFNSSC